MMLCQMASSGEKKEVGVVGGGVGAVVFTCSFCAVGYSSQDSLLEHLNNHVDIPHKPTNKGAFEHFMNTVHYAKEYIYDISLYIITETF